MANELYDIGRDLRANKLEEMDISTIGTNELSEQQKQDQLMGASPVQGLMHQDTPRQLIIPQQVEEQDAAQETAKKRESANYGLPIKEENDHQNGDAVDDHKANDSKKKEEFQSDHKADDENDTLNDTENGNHDAQNGKDREQLAVDADEALNESGNAADGAAKDIDVYAQKAAQEMNDHAKGQQTADTEHSASHHQNVEPEHSQIAAEPMSMSMPMSMEKD